MTRRIFELPDPQQQMFWLVLSLLGVALMIAGWYSWMF
jgi:hypothetical protein